MTRVLVLDDRAADRDLMTMVCRYAGYEVHEANTGEQALEMARSLHPDVITADILMPGMNGYEFVRALRADPDVGGVPVVFCSATYDDSEVKRVAEACGVMHILSKPATPEQMIRVVGEAMGVDPELIRTAGPALFDRRQLRVLNEKLVQKVDELETANHEQARLQEHLIEAERAAAESLTLLETLQSGAPIGFGLVDRDFRLLRMNAFLAALSDMPAEQQVGSTVAEIVPDLWPRLGPLYRRVLRSGQPLLNQELELPRADAPEEIGSWLLSFYPVELDDELLGIGLVVVDVTEVKQAEDFRSVVLETMAEGLYVVDHEGKLVLMNSAASRLLGWTEEELCGEPIERLIHHRRADGSVRPPEASDLTRARVEGRTIRTDDDAFTRKDGSIFPASSSSAPLSAGANLGGAVVVFRDTSGEMEVRLQRRRELDTLSWVGRIRDALDEGRMVLYSQPIVPLRGGEPSAELLLRMLDRDGDPVAPGAFLPVAEKYGLIAEIDQWVVGRAIELARDGRRLEANLSAESISNPDLLSQIKRDLKSTGVDPSNVVFEITETALMENLAAGQEFARELSELGCGLALDDFGTGFGSFTYLKSLPFRFIKIDIEFVRDLATNPANQLLVKATVSLARDFGHETIAEGVEDAETMELLKGYGVDYAQGYYLGRPAPIES